MTRPGIILLLAYTLGCASQGSDPSTLPRPVDGLVRYDATIGFDLEAGALDAEVTLRLPSSAAVGDTIRLLLNRGLTIQSVVGAAVRSHQIGRSDFSPAWQLVSVLLDEPVPAGADRTLTISYAGKPELPGDGINAVLPHRIELNLDSQWFPIPARIDHELVGVLRTRVPAGWQVASGGTVDHVDGAVVVRSQVPQVDVAFTATPGFRELPGRQFTILYNKAGERTARAVLVAAENCAGYLDGRFGGQDRFPGGRIVLADRPGPGYARKNYIVLSQVNPDSTESLHNFLCHEVAHYWTRFSGAMSPDYWLIETFAEYAAALYLRDRIGQAAFDRRLTIWEAGGRDAGPVWTPATQMRQPYAVAYRRGPYLLAQLERRIGQGTFVQFIDGYMASGIARTRGLIDHLQRVAGAEASAWFEAELARAPGP